MTFHRLAMAFGALAVSVAAVHATENPAPHQGSGGNRVQDTAGPQGVTPNETKAGDSATALDAGKHERDSRKGGGHDKAAERGSMGSHTSGVNGVSDEAESASERRREDEGAVHSQGSGTGASGSGGSGNTLQSDVPRPTR